MKRMVFAAVCAALSIVCGKYLAINVGEVLRFSLENLPLLLAGAVLGPVWGALTGAVADLVGCLLVGYAVNPVLTLGAMAVGLLAGAVFHGLPRGPLGLRTAAAAASAHLVGSACIKTLGLAAWYDYPLWELFLWRLLNYLLIGTLEALLVYVLLRNRAVQRQASALLPSWGRRWF
jgi:ECF transporter S component (folate family)